MRPFTTEKLKVLIYYFSQYTEADDPMNQMGPRNNYI